MVNPFRTGFQSCTGIIRYKSHSADGHQQILRGFHNRYVAQVKVVEVRLAALSKKVGRS